MRRKLTNALCCIAVLTLSRSATAQGGGCFSNGELMAGFLNAGELFGLVNSVTPDGNTDDNMFDPHELTVNDEVFLINGDGTQKYDVYSWPNARRSGLAMTSLHGDQVSCEINVYEGEYKKGIKGVDPLVFFDANSTIGHLTGDFLHELIHCCRGDVPLTPGATHPYSCLHLMIDTAVHIGLKMAADGLCEDIGNATDPGQAGAMQDQLSGICSAAKRLEDRWNTSQGLSVAQSCIADGPTPSDVCPDQYPTLPAGGDGDVLPPCDTCMDILQGASPCGG